MWCVQQPHCGHGGLLTWLLWGLPHCMTWGEPTANWGWGGLLNMPAPGCFYFLVLILYPKLSIFLGCCSLDPPPLLSSCCPPPTPPGATIRPQHWIRPLAAILALALEQPLLLPVLHPVIIIIHSQTAPSKTHLPVSAQNEESLLGRSQTFMSPARLLQHSPSFQHDKSITLQVMLMQTQVMSSSDIVVRISLSGYMRRHKYSLCPAPSLKGTLITPCMIQWIWCSSYLNSVTCGHPSKTTSPLAILDIN